MGIDPGAGGAVALILDVTEAEVYDMPGGPHDLAELVRFTRPVVAVVERAQSMPGQGLASTFAYGTGYGTVLGVLAALDVPFRTVAPVVWKRRFNLLGKDKGQSRERAQELYPQLAQHLRRVKDHGRAEALLIATWARLDGFPVGSPVDGSTPG